MDKRIHDINKILEDLGEPFRIEHKIVHKNNEALSAIMLNGGSISPTIYVDDEKFLSTPIGEEIAYLKEVYQSADMKFDTRYLDEPYILDNVYPRLVSKDNLKWIKEDGYLYKEFLDMVIMFYVRIGTDPVAVASYNLNKAHIKEHTINDIYGRALSNLKSEVCVMPMEHIIKEHIGIDMEPMGAIIVTNTWRLHGAAAILIPDLLYDISEHYGKDFIILPSSIHEVIAIPIGLTCNLEEAYSMVCEVNNTTVEPKDKLTDNVYIYDGSLRAYK